MSKFPFDVLIDVFRCLPAESLLRFRALSKPCCALIDSPDFVKHQLKHSLENNTNYRLIVENVTPYGLIYAIELDSLENSLKEIDRPFEPFVNGFSHDGMPAKCYGDVFGCCNGLLALYNPMSSMTLWNPSTKKHQTLPNFWGGPRYFGECFLDGFGYDVVSDDYKVIRMVQVPDQAYFPEKPGSSVMVYSLKTNSSRRIQDFPFYTVESRHAGVYVGRSLHWAVRSRRNGSRNNLIVAFDLGEETFHTVPMPDLQPRFNIISLGVFRGCLSMTCKCRHVKNIGIWMMEEYGVKESWTRICSFSEGELENYQFGRLHMRPLDYSKTGHDILLELDNRNLFWYDLETRRHESVKICGDVPNKIRANLCVRSLVPLNVE